MQHTSTVSQNAAPAPPKPEVVVVMPAYNEAQTLRLTYGDIPRDLVDRVVPVDDGSSDETLQIAKDLGLEVFIHNHNYGDGAIQKTGYRESLRLGAYIVVMLHPDYQYDPTLLPEMIAPIQEGRVDVVLGSRLMGVSPIKQGMPWWKFVGNLLLTRFENWVLRLKLYEYPAYSRRAFES